MSTMRWHSPCCKALFAAEEWPEAVDEDSRRRALCKKLPWPDRTGAGVYGSSPVLFAPWGSITPFGVCGPMGTVGSGTASRAAPCGMDAGGVLLTCGVWEDDENLDEMLESHEGLRGGEGDVPGAFFSPGRGGADFGGVGTGADSTCEGTEPFSTGAGTCSTGTGGTGWRGCES